MLLRRLLPALALAGILLVPASSPGASSTLTLSGLIKRTPGGITILITNKGPDPAKFVWIGLRKGVRHKSASADQGGGCAPGGDEYTVRCTWGSIPAGETRTATIMTDVAYPANAGADLYSGDFFNSTPVPAGTATGPAAAEECKCTSLTARILPKSLKVKIFPFAKPTETLRLDFDVKWTITCAPGDGGCSGELVFVAPRLPPNKRTKDPGYSTTWGKRMARTEEIECESGCAQSESGVHDMFLVGSPLGPDMRAGESLPIVVKRTCQGKTLPPIRLSIAFDDNGKIDLRKSKLG